MSLRDKFKVDIAAATDGVWLDYVPNSDGTVPGFKVSRMAIQNKRYAECMKRAVAHFEGGAANSAIENISPEEADKILFAVFIDSVVLDWRNFQPDDDGVSLPFSKEAAAQLFGDPAWSDLYEDVKAKAQKAATFREKQREAKAKN